LNFGAIDLTRGQSGLIQNVRHDDVSASSSVDGASLRRSGVSVSEDAAAVREAARGQTSYYPQLPYYAQMLLDAGYSEIKEGKFSDRMIDDMVVHGSAEQVKERLRTLPSFGVDELLATVIEPKNDDQTYRRTVRVLGELAAE